MENATKALLIAAAILVAILVISLGLVVYRMAAETIGNANLSEAEMAEFNGKFESAAGPKVSGAKVNALLATVLSHNMQADAAGESKVTVSGGTGTSASGAAVTITTDASGKNTGSITKVNTGAYYKVELTYDGNGLVSTITITK